MYIRKCKDCGIGALSEEDLDFFVKNKESKFGRKNLCIICSSSRKKEKYTYKRVRGDWLRKCNKCGIEATTNEDLDSFVNHSGALYGKRNLCKQCKAILDSADSRRNSEYLRRYGITSKEYKECMNTSSSCQICGGTSKLCYDHDHITMGFRGVLCQSCNGALGILGDNLDGLLKAVEYLKGKGRECLM